MGLEKEKIILRFKKLRPEARIPEYATAGSAGADLRACVDAPLTLAPHAPVTVPTGLAVAAPPGYAAMIFARSGLATKHGIGLSNGVGVVDSDYRGEVRVGMINQSETPYTIENGDRIAQLVLVPVARAETLEVSELDDTGRGEGGFGSTGR